MRREDVTNVYDKHWTADWWGWTTLTMLSQQRGLPTEAQAMLAMSIVGEKAIQDGIITDKNITRYYQSGSHADQPH